MAAIRKCDGAYERRNVGAQQPGSPSPIHSLFMIASFNG